MHATPIIDVKPASCTACFRLQVARWLLGDVAPVVHSEWCRIWDLKAGAMARSHNGE